MDQNQEIELLEKTARGDHTAFTLLFDTYHHSLAAFIFSVTKSKELAEEITLDVFLKIWMARETLSEVRNFKAFLFTLSRNAAIDNLRKIITARTRHAEWTKDASVRTPDDDTEKEACLTLIDEAINELSPQRKKIYLLSREQGMKYDEIAAQLEISRFTVRAHIQQAVESIVQYVRQRTNIPIVLLCALLSFLIKK